MKRIASALLLALAPSVRAADPTQVLKGLEESGRALRTMKAEFVETKVSVLLDETTEQKGDVLLQVPGRFRWNYTAPSPGAMVIKDGQFARYVPQSKQVFRGAAKGEADLLVGFGPGAAGLGNKYDVRLLGEESVGASTAHVLDLLPKKGQSGLFAAIRLWVDKARSIPVQTRLTEPTGDHTTVRFEKVQINTPLGASAFDLKLPRDVVEVK
ncbi:MAG TPA: outer membrane lipoprotein carrier protein LolA [Vicinamibacteria bacterium]|nr:outer membrane lipoprotein carrier protein LolA [Vicinamibacteria bacterium]